MQEDGYLLLRGILDRDEVLEARQEVTRRLASMNLLEPGGDLMETMNEIAADNGPLEKVLYDGPMMRFFDGLLGEPAKHFDFTWFRAVLPGSNGAPPHTDVIFMGREERDRLFTAWTPIGDVDLEQGGLIVLEGSNNHPGLRDGYSRTDVDSYCSNREDSRDWWNRRIDRAEEGRIAEDAAQVRRVLGGRWLTTEYSAGDVLIFSVFTVHASLDNRSDRIRLSSDSRYQPASKPADSRWIGPNPVGHGPEAKRALIC
jgi:ectoine hydroxylase-related dioxygenase (phytanoyl-CoA dioxygenase family)